MEKSNCTMEQRAIPQQSERDRLTETLWMGSSLKQQQMRQPIMTLSHNLLQAYKKEEEYLQQRSMQLWFTLGDRNTWYFLAAARGRRAKNRLDIIEDSEGNIFYEEEQIADTIANYFREIFSSTTVDCSGTVHKALKPQISATQNDNLITPPTAEEIRLAVFSIHPDKTPGPDGFSTSFFQSNWENLRSAIIKEVQQFFSEGTLPHTVNSTHIRLIPKITNPKLVSEYMPIALCNVYYKVISKILSLRLKPLLQEVISENHSAFIPGRAISDNILITHETLHYLKTSKAEKHCSMAIKSDMSKAYDRLEWGFIECILSTLGFHELFVT